MHKFTCTKCSGMCELIINCDDLEDQAPYRCHSADYIDPEWIHNGALPRKLTCVYCGKTYPEGTPPHGAKILTDHIKVCEKHPMREAETKIAKLRDALAALVGASTKEELEAMEMVLRSSTAPEADKAAAINAIHALLETDGV